MKDNQNTRVINSLEILTSAIQDTNAFFLNKVQKQVNTSLTLRNWIIGFYIVEYEQSGKDWADYGSHLFKTIAKKLLEKGVKSLQERNLYMCRDFYGAYPQILQTMSAKSYLVDFRHSEILQTLSAELPEANFSNDLNQLITNLGFSHFIELLKADSRTKRQFYEVQAIKNNWGVRDLKRAIDSLLFERIGLSTDKESVLEKHSSGKEIKPEDVFRNTYLLELLRLGRKAVLY